MKKENWAGNIGREISDYKLYTINFPMANENRRRWAGRPPPLFHFTQIKILELCVCRWISSAQTVSFGKLQGCLKEFFFKLAKIWLNGVWTRRKGRTMNIEMSKYSHLLPYNYLRSIVKNFKNKYVKKNRKTFFVIDVWTSSSN